MRVWHGLMVTAIVVSAGAVGAADSPDRVIVSDSAADYLPADLPVVVTLRHGDQRLMDIRGFLKQSGLMDDVIKGAVEQNPGLAAARIGLLGLAAASDMDAWSAIGALLGRETVMGLTPGPGGRPRVVVVSVARDPAALDRFLHQVHVAAGIAVSGEIDPSRVRTYSGARIISINDDFFQCRFGDALIVSNDGDLIKRAIDAKTGKTARLSASDRYRGQQEVATSATIGWSILDLPALRALAGDKGLFAERLGNPLGGFLLGGWSHALRHCDSLNVRLTAEEGGLSLVVTAEPMEPLKGLHHAFMLEPRSAPRWSSGAVPHFLGVIRVDRDWASLFADRESLLTLPAASGVVNFNTVLSTLLGELDFMDDFLAKVNGPVQFVFTRQDFSARPYDPTPKLPGMALLIPLDFQSDPELADILQSAALRTVTIVGMDQAQKNQPSLMTHTETYEGIELVYGKYRAPSRADDDDDKALVPIQYNFAPAIAIVGDRFIISTTRELLYDLIDARREASAAAQALDYDELVVDLSMLERILHDNLDELVANRMLEENETRAQAEKFFGALFATMTQLDSLKVTSRGTREGFEGRIFLHLAKPVQR